MEITSDYLEDYINHKLSKEERNKFNERLNSDALFAEEVKKHIYMINSFDETQAQSLINRFKQIEGKIDRHDKTEIRLPLFFRWAAVVAVIATLSVVAYLNFSISDKELFLAYYTAYPNVDSPVSRSESSNESLWLNYENRNFQEAYEQFNEKVMANDNDDTSWFYLGICAIELNLLPEAEAAFAKVTMLNKSKYKEQAQWYLALNYLKAGDKSKSEDTLKEIELSGSSYAQKAKKLLREL